MLVVVPLPPVPVAPVPPAAPVPELVAPLHDAMAVAATPSARKTPVQRCALIPRAYHRGRRCGPSLSARGSSAVARVARRRVGGPRVLGAAVGRGRVGAAS